MSRKRKSPVSKCGVSTACCFSRSTASRAALYSRSTALIRVSQANALPGMALQLFQNLPKRGLRQRPGLPVAEFRNDGSVVCHVMDVPPVAVVIQTSNVVVCGHQVEVDHAVGPWCRARDRFKEHACCVFL